MEKERFHISADEISRGDGHTIDDDVKMFFILGNALMDLEGPRGCPVCEALLPGQQSSDRSVGFVDNALCGERAQASFRLLTSTLRPTEDAGLFTMGTTFL